MVMLAVRAPVIVAAAIVAALLATLEDLAVVNDADIVLTTWTSEAFAAAQGVRKRRAAEAGATITPSGDRMKFIGASAMKADRVLVLGRQEWTGRLAGCGEGKTSGATRTFVSKAYLTDTSHDGFDEAFADKTRRIGVSEELQRCLEIAGTASLVSTLPLDPDNVIVNQLNEITLSGSYHLYNLRTNETELLFRANGRTSPGLFDPRTGKVLTRVELESVGGSEYEQRISILDEETGEFELHDKLSNRLTERHSVGIVGRDEATGKYYVLTDLFADQMQAWMYDPAKREFDSEPLLAHPQFSIGSLIFGSQPSDFNRVLGFTVGDMQRTAVYVDPEMRAIHDGIKAAFPDQSVVIGGYNDDRSRVLFTTHSAQHPPSYHLLLDRKRVQTLGSQRPWIDAGDIGEQRWVSYRARDGMQIPAILDLPAGWTPEDGPLPTVIHPHGGPWARDYGGWDLSGWVPFLTSRGYAVLRPQYRGSAGLGRELWLAGDSQWGKAMQDDKDDGAAWLVEQGIADRDRLAIFGYSYGGFAAAAAAVRPDSPYQCAISGAPVTDLGRLGTSWSEDRLQRILQGRTVTGMDPMLNAGKAALPILLYVGDRDVRTPAFHARDFYETARLHTTAKFELIPDMPHSMPWYYRHHQKTLGLIEHYLAEECGPEGL
ncbi:MAG: prolyl oligopeptidase family serine peptidase [Proteobacteria bacterium]|nr:prolyl oligopeptidase family serine peptidase [Pseudomonadota bacterium]